MIVEDEFSKNGASSFFLALGVQNDRSKIDEWDVPVVLPVTENEVPVAEHE